MKKIISLISLLGILVKLFGAEDPFPLITRLHSQDPRFKQYLADVETARQRSKPSPEAIAEALTVYAYRTLPQDDLLSLAARCMVPYSTLATINRISRQGNLDPQTLLLLPSAPGLFIPENPESDLEQLMRSSRINREGIPITLTWKDHTERFQFIPGEDFSPTERIFFFHSGFRYPLRNFRLTSDFGMRVNPVTGTLRNHNGLDLAAPLGTEVYAVREGTVREIGEDPIYGKYIIIQHGEGWVSLYGHLSKVETVLRRKVESGTLIGRVGSTGQSTGPHLHFELRQHGKAQDPGKYLFKEGT